MYFSCPPFCGSGFSEEWKIHDTFLCAGSQIYNRLPCTSKIHEYCNNCGCNRSFPELSSNSIWYVSCAPAAVLSLPGCVTSRSPVPCLVCGMASVLQYRLFSCSTLWIEIFPHILQWSFSVIRYIHSSPSLASIWLWSFQLIPCCVLCVQNVVAPCQVSPIRLFQTMHSFCSRRLN